MSLRRRGFTLIEATIGGGVLMVGMILVAQLTQFTLSAGGTADPQVSQETMIVDQYVKAAVARIKGERNAPLLAPAAILQPLRLPAADIYVAQVTPVVEGSSLIAGNVGPLVNTGRTYQLVRYDLIFRQTVAGTRVQNPGTNQIVAQTSFWIVGSDSGAKIGL